MRSAYQISKWHPDKYADQIADVIYQTCVQQDLETRCDLKVLCKGTTIAIFGELETRAIIEIDSIVETAAKYCRYPVEKILKLYTSDCLKDDNYSVMHYPVIAHGYCYLGTESGLPLEFHYANKLMREFEKFVERDDDKIFFGDARVNVTMSGNSIKSVDFDACINPKFSYQEAYQVLNLRLKNIVPYKNSITLNLNYQDWNLSGPLYMAGASGRQLACDNYGQSLPVNASFSGKDMTHLERSAAYVAHALAKEYCKEWHEDVFVEANYFSGTCIIKFVVLGLTHCTEHYLLTEDVINFLDVKNINFQQIAGGCQFYEGMDKYYPRLDVQKLSKTT